MNRPLSLLILLALTHQAFALAFESLSLPTSLEETFSVRSSHSFQHLDRQYPLKYQTLIRSGEPRAGQRFGLLYDRQGKPIRDADGNPRISRKNDFSSLLQRDGSLYMLTHFEEIPGAIYLSQLRQDPRNGHLEVVRFRPLDLSAIGGGWNHCAGSVTPWQTHLGTEEYEPDAAARKPGTGAIDHHYQAMSAYAGGDPAQLYPYDYGWQLEIVVEDFERVAVSKRFAMGRLSHEVGLVMPDRKTVYITDDAHNTALFRFVADRPGDLSSGVLYAAKWRQVSDEQGGYAKLDWIDLGHATEQDIQLAMQKKPHFGELFKHKPPIEDGACPIGFTPINTRFGSECLQLKPGMETLASRLESRRYAAILGATTEFRKMEGLSFDPATRRLFVAISKIDRGMEDRQHKGTAVPNFDQGGPNHIRLPNNPCGAVYQLGLNEEYVAVAMQALLNGRQVDDDPDNHCSTETIANPDNLTFLTGQERLIIAEDSATGHLNNMLWSYHFREKRLTRLLTAPLGAEVTGSYYYPDINGWGYLMCAIQHPAEGPAITGYLGPFPADD
ncbi:MAG: DUF839 domain-containing protein [Candidatus Thiodiazotropha sp. (ex Epidulcina cf. delphinae)]|nr:DUF839 domain-containing protein [Candidatus Thiodiazotropha sp. (ex Epidulcina cf. delphinae)]